MAHRLGMVLFVLWLLAAVILATMGIIMLVNRVADAVGGAIVLFILSAVFAGAGTAARYLLGWNDGRTRRGR